MSLKITNTQVGFSGEVEFLSNMYLCNIKMTLSEREKHYFPKILKLEKKGIIHILDGLSYNSTEHVYQSAKSNNPNWKEILEKTTITNPNTGDTYLNCGEVWKFTTLSVDKLRNTDFNSL